MPVTKRRGTVFVQLMTLETFQAVFGGSKGEPGASWGGSGCHGRAQRGAGRWRTVVAKRASRRRVGRSGQAT